MGLSRTTLISRMKKLGIDPGDFAELRLSALLRVGKCISNSCGDGII